MIFRNQVIDVSTADLVLNLEAVVDGPEQLAETRVAGTDRPSERGWSPSASSEIMRSHRHRATTAVWRWQERFMHEGVEASCMQLDKTRPSRIVPPLGREIGMTAVVALTLSAPFLPSRLDHIGRRRQMAKTVGISVRTRYSPHLAGARASAPPVGPAVQAVA